MNKTKILSVLALLLLTTPLWAQSERKKVDGVAAVVGDYLILESDIDKAYIDLKQQEVDTKYHSLPDAWQADGGQTLRSPSCARQCEANRC